MPGGILVASASTEIWTSCWSSRPSGGDLAGHGDRDVDGDLLAAPDQDQVDVLDGALDRVTLHGLGQGQLAAAGQAVEPDQDVRGAQREQDVVAGQADDAAAPVP